MSGSRWVITPSWLSGPWRSFLYSSSVYSCHLLLISSASVRPRQFLSFIEPIFAWNVPLVSLILLKRSLVCPILFFSSISLHWSLKKSCLSLLAILWNSAFRCLYLSFSPLLFASPLFTAMCKAYPESHFAFLHFFFKGMVLILVSCTMSRTEMMEFQLSSFKSWKMMLWKCCTQFASKSGKLSSGHRTGKDQFSFQSQRKAMPKTAQTTAQLHSSHMLVK